MAWLTARLRLDALRETDAPALLRYRADPRVSRYQGWRPADESEALRFIRAQQASRPDLPGSWWQRAIRLREDDTLVGDLGLHFLDDASAATVELGISLAPERQGQGLAVEVLRAAFEQLFGALGKHRVIASVDPRNTACVRLLERLGMRKEAHFRASLRDGDGWADDAVYALLDVEWRAGRTEQADRG